MAKQKAKQNRVAFKHIEPEFLLALVEQIRREGVPVAVLADEQPVDKWKLGFLAHMTSIQKQTLCSALPSLVAVLLNDDDSERQFLDDGGQTQAMRYVCFRYEALRRLLSLIGPSTGKLRMLGDAAPKFRVVSDT